MVKPMFDSVKRVLRYIDSLLDRVTRLLWLLAGLLIALMALVVGYGVFTRYVLRSADPYTFEINSILMIAIAVFSIAYTQRQGRHLRIDILDHHFSDVTRGVMLNIVGPIIALVFCGVLVWKTLDAALFALEISEMTSGTLVIPTFPLRIMVTIGVGFLCLILIAQILRSLNLFKGSKRS